MEKSCECDLILSFRISALSCFAAWRAVPANTDRNFVGTCIEKPQETAVLNGQAR